MNDFLLPLEIEGLGTSEVESFSSYFSRLAYLHGISRSQLVRLLARWRSVTTGVEYRLSETPVYTTQGAGLLGFGDRVEEYLQICIEAGCSEDLRRSTLVPIRDLLPSTCLQTVKSDRAWCEQCFAEDLQTMEIPFDRMVWSLRPIQRCHIHRLKLRAHCPKCGVVQRFHHRSGNPGLCVKCGESLIGPSSKMEPLLEPSFGEKDCIQLVDAIARGKLDEVDNGAYEVFTKELKMILSPLARVVGNISEPSGTAKAQNRKASHNLMSLLKKAFAAGVPLVDIFIDPKMAARAAGQLIFDANDIPVEAKVRHPEGLKEEMASEMLKYLAKPRTEMIPSLRELAYQSGVSVGYIRHNFPEIVKKYQSHRLAANIFRIRRTRELCENELRRLIDNGKVIAMFSTKKELEAHLIAVTACTAPMARLAMKQMIPN